MNNPDLVKCPYCGAKSGWLYDCSVCFRRFPNALHVPHVIVVRRKVKRKKHPTLLTIHKIATSKFRRPRWLVRPNGFLVWYHGILERNKRNYLQKDVEAEQSVE